MKKNYLIMGSLCLAGLLGIGLIKITFKSDSNTYSSSNKVQFLEGYASDSSQEDLDYLPEGEIRAIPQEIPDTNATQQMNGVLQNSIDMQQLREKQKTRRVNYASTCRNTQLINPYHDCSEYDDVPMTAQHIKAVSEGAMSCSNLQALNANHDCSGYEHLARQVLKSAERHGQLPSDISEFEQPAPQSAPNVSPHIQERMYDDNGKAYDENTDYIRGS